jgi:hypothetical protein
VNLLEEPDAGNLQVRFCDNLVPPGNQAANGENRPQPKYREKPVYSTPKRHLIERR